MKVLWFCPYPYPGVNQHPAYWITEWATHLSKNTNLDIHIVSFTPFCKGNIEDLNQDGIKVTYIKSPRGTLDLLSLYKIRISALRKYFEANQNKYDLIHIHGIENQFQAACVNSKIPVIISIQGIVTESYSILKGNPKLKFHWYLTKLYEKKFLNITRNYFCRTDWDKKFIRENVKDARIFHNWEMIRNEFESVTPDKNSTRVLFTGGTHPGKGLDIALKVLKKINAAEKKFTLVIAGSYYENVLDRILSQNGFTRKSTDIEIKGFLDTGQMVEEFQKSFCLLHPTLIDNSANTVCESQLAGLPVVATNVGGVSSLIVDGENGLLSEVNVDKVSELVLKLSEDKILWEKISQRSKVDAKVRHDRNEITQITMDTYETLKDKRTNSK